jgi:hypothetical protein
VTCGAVLDNKKRFDVYMDRIEGFRNAHGDADFRYLITYSADLPG